MKEYNTIIVLQYINVIYFGFYILIQYEIVKCDSVQYDMIYINKYRTT